jgi:hypothetical protein
MTSRSSLYELGEEFASLEAILIETGGEWTEEVEAKFAELGELQADKIDAYASLCRSQDAYQRALKDEENALRDKRKTSENLVARLRSRLFDYMQARGVKEIRGHIWKAAIQANGGMRSLTLIVAPEQLPAEFQVVTIEADTGKLREMAEQNTTGDLDPVELTVDGNIVARLEPRSSSVRFR